MSKPISKGMLAAALGMIAASGVVPMDEMPRMREKPQLKELSEFDLARMRKAQEKRERKAKKRLADAV
jgi:hypothetical protein